jgi:glycerol kinase
MESFSGDGAPWQKLRIDGGMSANNWIAQDLADLLNLEVERPADVETTALGAAMLAGIGAGWFSTLEEAGQMRPDFQSFKPAMAPDVRDLRITKWHELVAATEG